MTTIWITKEDSLRNNKKDMGLNYNSPMFICKTLKPVKTNMTIGANLITIHVENKI